MRLVPEHMPLVQSALHPIREQGVKPTEQPPQFLPACQHKEKKKQREEALLHQRAHRHIAALCSVSGDFLDLSCCLSSCSALHRYQAIDAHSQTSQAHRTHSHTLYHLIPYLIVFYLFLLRCGGAFGLLLSCSCTPPAVSLGICKCIYLSSLPPPLCSSAWKKTSNGEASG